MRDKIAAGTTSYSSPIFVTNSASGSGMPGLVFNTNGLVGEYRRANTNSWTAITLAAGTLGTWSTNGWIADGSLNGAYEVGIPNAALAANASWVAVRYYGASNMLPVLMYFELDAVNYQSNSAFIASVNSVGGVTGNVNGNVIGSVASVTGSVNSVSGNVNGSVSGNVGSVAGNVNGSVASISGNVNGNVTGAVGSVTGNVNGSVIGSVNSVSGNVNGNVGSVAGNVNGNVGSVSGNVNGSVASVTGSVNSVSGNVNGNVGSVSGNVNGNVTGSVNSVAGDIGGNIAGNVQGNVIGSVQSVANPIFVGGYSAGQDPATLVLDANQDDHLVAGSIGLSISLAAGTGPPTAQPAFPFFLTLSSGNGLDPATGVTVVAERSTDGADFVALDNADAVSEVGGGDYTIDLTANDVTFNSSLMLRFTADGCVAALYSYLAN